MHVHYTTDKELKERFNTEPDLFLRAYEELVGLDMTKVKDGRGKFQVRCPFHDDETPSAAFIKRPGGGYVFKCSAASCPASRKTRSAFNALVDYGSVEAERLLEWTARRTGAVRSFAVRGGVSKLEPSPRELVERADPQADVPDVEHERYDLDYWAKVYADAYARLEGLNLTDAPPVLRGFIVAEARSLGLGIRRICGEDVLMMVKRSSSGAAIGFKTRYTPEAAACIRRIVAEREGIEDPEKAAAIHWPKYREHPAGVHVPWVSWGLGREVYVVEGELNAMSAAVVLPQGVTVIGLPGQDPGVLKNAEYASLLRGARRIYAYFDEHAAGRNFLDFLEGLGTWRQPFDLSKVTLIPPLGGGTDFNDLLQEDRGRLIEVLFPRAYVEAPALSTLDLDVPEEWSPGILRNRPALIFGPPGAHKTAFTTGYVFAALTGVSPFPGVPVNLDGYGFDRVVYVSFEEPGQVLWNLGAFFEGLEPEMRRVWPEWFEHPDPLQAFFDHAARMMTLVPGHALGQKSIGEILDAYARTGEHTLLVFDPFGYFLNLIGDENSAETVAAVWDAITAKTEQIADAGGSLTTLLVDHVNLANFMSTIKALKEGKNPVSVAPRGNMRKLDKPRSVRMLVTYPPEGWVRPPVVVAGRKTPGVLVREEMVKNSFGGTWTRYWTLGYVELDPGKRVAWRGQPLTIRRAMRIVPYDREAALAYVPPEYEVEEEGEGPIYLKGWKETLPRPEKVVTTDTVTDAEELMEVIEVLLDAGVVNVNELDADRETVDFAVQQLERQGKAQRRGDLIYPRKTLFPRGTREWEAMAFTLRALRNGREEVTFQEVKDHFITRYGLRKSWAHDVVKQVMERLEEEGLVEVVELKRRGRPRVARRKADPSKFDVYL